jgi:hypothetical protein
VGREGVIPSEEEGTSEEGMSEGSSETRKQ